MPIYEYQCEKCGAHIEALQKISDAPLSQCEKCQGKLNKILSQSSFVLKGSGWYLTDYSKKSSASSSSTTTTTTKTETESAAPKCAAGESSGGGCGSGACGTGSTN